MADDSGNKVWFITGCSSGFGRALSEAVLARGDRLIATARNLATIQDLADRAPDQCHVLELDITHHSQVHQIIQRAEQIWGRLDVVVNNAGCGLIGAIEECSPQDIQQSFAVNFHGPLEVMRAVLPILRAQKSGHIVNISAAAAISNYAGFGIYGAAKAALELASESLRAEVAPLGIRLTVVQPGPFRTDFIGRSLQRPTTTLPDYAGTSGKFGEWLGKIDGRQPGDPIKAAQAIVDMVHSDAAPLRLPLGRYVVKKIRDKAAAMTREMDQWQSIAESADF